MQCTRCKSDSTSRIEFTKAEGLSAAMTGRAAAAHPIGVAVKLAEIGAKYACSQAYSCNNCGHQWRKWF